MAKKSSSTNHHYVPQGLLKNFGAGKKKHIYAFDKQTGRKFQSTARNIASERGFYDFDGPESGWEIETELNKVETPAIDIIRGILQRTSLAGLLNADREVLALFCALQFVRGKFMRETYSHINETFVKFVAATGGDLGKVAEGFLLSPGELKKQGVKMLALAVEFAEHIFMKQWLLLKASPGRKYYIGDNPVVMNNSIQSGDHYGNLGLAVPGVEVYLPISSKLCLGFWCPSLIDFLDGRRSEVDEALNRAGMQLPPKEADNLFRAVETGAPLQNTGPNMTFYNSLQVLNASRFVYCCEPDFELAREMIATNPETRSGPRFTVRGGPFEP